LCPFANDVIRSRFRRPYPRHGEHLRQHRDTSCRDENDYRDGPRSWPRRIQFPNPDARITQCHKPCQSRLALRFEHDTRATVALALYKGIIGIINISSEITASAQHGQAASPGLGIREWRPAPGDCKICAAK
jgi:hypothetical protein